MPYDGLPPPEEDGTDRLLRLENLLRNLPENFRWDYGQAATCAIGLGYRHMGAPWEGCSMRSYYGITTEEYHYIFCNWFPFFPPRLVRPWLVAYRIRKVLKQKETCNALVS